LNIGKKNKKDLKEPTDLYVKGFEKAYWLERDKQAGQIEGVKAVIAQKDTTDISAYYTLVADGETVTDGKRGIKNPKVFEMAFFLAVEAARSSGDDADKLLDKLTKKENKEDETKEEQIERVLKETKDVAIEYAKEKSIQYGAYQAAKELGVLGKLQKLNDIHFAKEIAEEEANIKKLEDAGYDEKGKELIKLNKNLKEYTEKEKKYANIRGKYDKLYKKFVGKDEKAEILDDAEKGMNAADSYLPSNGGTEKLEFLLELKKKEEKEPKETDKKPKKKGKPTDADIIKELTVEQKQPIYDTYERTYEQQKAVEYNNSLAEFSNIFMFGVGLLDVTETIEGNVEPAAEENKNTSKEEDIGNAIKKILAGKELEKKILAGKELEGGDGGNISLDNLDIVDVFQEQEVLLQLMNVQIEKDRKVAYQFDFDVFDLEDDKEKRETKFGMTQEELEEGIAALEKKKEEEGPLNIAESTKLGNYRGRLKKLEKINVQIEKLQTSSMEAYEDIELSTEKIRQFFKSQLKFDVPREDNDYILDYVDYFDRKLLLDGSFNYTSSNLNISGSGGYDIFENAEDVQVFANVSIDKGDYSFTSSGFRYIEDADHMTLFRGTAVIPRLEGDESADVLQEYTFDDIGIDLSSGLRGQLKMQSSKLIGGPVLNSSGDRKNKTNPKNLDVDGEQNISTEPTKK